MNTDGNTDAINRHLYELEQYQMQDEIDTLHDEVDRLEGQRDELLGALKTIAGRAQHNTPEFYQSWHHAAAVAIAECKADQ